MRGLERAPPGVDTEMWRKLFQPRQGKLEIHVEANHNTWWAMPHELSEGLLKNLRRGHDQGMYEWNWQGQGTEYDEDGEETTHVQYRVDFGAMREYIRSMDDDFGVIYHRAQAIKIVERLASAAPPDVNPEVWRKICQPGQEKLEIHVELNHNMWWAMPHELSEDLLKNLRSGKKECFYAWDSQNQCTGSYEDDGEETTHVKYKVDFGEMRHRNIVNHRADAIKIVEVLASGADQ